MPSQKLLLKGLLWGEERKHVKPKEAGKGLTAAPKKTAKNIRLHF